MLRTNGLNVRVLSCLGADLEIDLLPHFLHHYQGLGISANKIHFLLNSQDDQSPSLQAARRILHAAGAPAPEWWIAPYTSDGMWEQRRRLQARVARSGEWIINADADEHHRYPASLAEVIRYCERHAYNCVQGVLIDRLAPGGELKPVDAAVALSRQFPIEAEIALSVIGTGSSHGPDATVKLMLHRADVFPRRGGHNPLGNGVPLSFLAGDKLAGFRAIHNPAFRFRFPFQVHHYKWTATREISYERRVATPGASSAGREFGGKMLMHIQKAGGIDLGRAAVRRPADMLANDWKGTMRRMRVEAALRRQFRRAVTLIPVRQFHFRGRDARR